MVCVVVSSSPSWTRWRGRRPPPPHDHQLLGRVEGLQPKDAPHQSFWDVEPLSGVAARAVSRAQFSALVSDWQLPTVPELDAVAVAAVLDAVKLVACDFLDPCVVVRTASLVSLVSLGSRRSRASAFDDILADRDFWIESRVSLDGILADREFWIESRPAASVAEASTGSSGWGTRASS